MPEEKAQCVECGVVFLATTAARTGGKCIPCLRGTRASVEEGAKRNAEERRRRKANEEARQRILEKVRPKLGDFLAEEDPVRVLWLVILDTVIPKPERRQRIEALGMAARVIYLAHCVVGEVYNGGFHQYFANSSGDHAHAAHQALLALGAVQRARLLGLAIGAFPDGQVPTDELERNTELDDADAARPTFFDGLDAEFYALDVQEPAVEDFDDLMLAFMEKHAMEAVASD